MLRGMGVVITRVSLKQLHFGNIFIQTNQELWAQKSLEANKKLQQFYNISFFFLVEVLQHFKLSYHLFITIYNLNFFIDPYVRWYTDLKWL